mgnify:CR=1 FL=1
MKQAVNDVAPMKAVHVGLECNDEHEVHCEEEGPCVVKEAEKTETLPTTSGTNYRTEIVNMRCFSQRAYHIRNIITLIQFT